MDVVMTFYAFLSNCDAGDPLEFLSYYIPSSVIAFLAIVLLNSILFFVRGWNRKHILILTASVVFCWGIYFFLTAP